jgi:hypothetical protein
MRHMMLPIRATPLVVRMRHMMLPIRAMPFGVRLTSCVALAESLPDVTVRASPRVRPSKAVFVCMQLTDVNLSNAHDTRYDADPTRFRADATMSLDVIYHLVEDDVFDKYEPQLQVIDL